MPVLIKVSTIAALLALMATDPVRVRAQEPSFDAVAPLLRSYCISCHSGSKPKGELDLANLAPDFATNEAAWKSVFERLNEGSMPPKGKPRPNSAEQATILSWVTSGLAAHQG